MYGRESDIAMLRYAFKIRLEVGLALGPGSVHVDE
jgi:hypothetical protein